MFLSDDGKPWERQHRETEPAWAAFSAYRDMDRPRSVRAIAQTLRKSSSLVLLWSRTWSWLARCDAYDAMIDQQALQARVEAIQEMNRRHVQLSVTVQTLLARRLQQLLVQDGDGNYPNLARVAPASLASLLDTSVKLERLSRGETTENIGHRDAPDLPPGPNPLTALVLGNPESIALAAALARSLGQRGVEPVRGPDPEPDRNDISRILGRPLQPE